MAIEGSLQVLRLPEILQMISSQDKTGILTVQGENDIVAISFKDGNVVAADALNQTVEEGLGQVLASQGLVSPDDFARVTAEHEAGTERLLDLLVDQGYVDRGQLLDSLRVQTYQLMLQLLRWEQGEFKFYSGDEVAFEEGFSPISVEELLIRSVTDLGDDGQGPALPNLEVAYEPMNGGASLKVLGVDGDGPMDDPEALWLSDEEKSLYDRFDGTTVARDVAAQSGLGDYKVLYTLYRLLGARCVRPSKGTGVGPAPEPSSPATDTTQFETFTPIPVEMPEPEALAPVELFDEPDDDDTEPEAPVERPRRPPVELSPALPRWVARSVAAVAAAGLLISLQLGPSATVVIDLPWIGGVQADELELNLRTALYRSIDRAARTFFLLEGHYPDSLDDLVNAGLLDERHLRDPRGRHLAYTADEVSYTLQPIEAGAPVVELSTGETIAGDFLLDPDFLSLPEVSEQPPLVLLD